MEQEIKTGMKLKHFCVNKVLTIAADEKGPAYTGNEFEDDEISLSFAKTEIRLGNAELIQDTAHTEGKEGFTKGNWLADGKTVVIDGTFPEVEVCICESHNDAFLIAESKNMYDLLYKLITAPFGGGGEVNVVKMQQTANAIINRINKH